MQAHLSGSTLIPFFTSLPSNPYRIQLSALPRGQEPRPDTAASETQKKAGSCPIARQHKKQWLLQKSALVFNGHVIWLISYHVCHALSSSSKSTKFREKKKEIIIAKDGQISQEALILKRENRNRGKWWAFPPCTLRNWGSRGGRREAALGSETCQHVQVLVAMVPSCWLARFHQHSLSATVPVLWAAARKKKNCCLYSNGCWATEYCAWKEQGKNVRHRKKAAKMRLNPFV